MSATFRFVTRRQYGKMNGTFGDHWSWYAVDEQGRYLKGFNERILPTGRYRVSRAPKTGRFLVKRDGYYLYTRSTGGWRIVDCPDFCVYGMRQLGILLGRAFNVIPVGREK